MFLFSYIISPLANIIPFGKLWTITNYELRYNEKSAFHPEIRNSPFLICSSKSKLPQEDNIIINLG